MSTLQHYTQRAKQAWKKLRTPTKKQAISPAPNMYIYHIPLDGGQKRLHLRIEDGGSGVLFIDVTQVVHLNSTAATMAKMALDDVPLEQAEKAFHHHFRSVTRDQLSQELAHIYQMVDQLRSSGHTCPTCAIADVAQMKPLFSVPVNAPYKADLALWYGCNNRCSHCYNERERGHMRSLSLPEWYRVIDTLVSKGVPHIILTGGEATIHPHMTELIAYADGRGAIVGLNTNGRKLADRAFTQTLVDAGLNHVQVTLGSCYADVHNAMVNAPAFEETVQGIRTALDCSLHTITNTTILRQNMDHIDELIVFLHSLGIRTFALNSVIAAGGGVENPDALRHEELAPLLVRVRTLAEDMDMRFLWYTPTEYCRLSPMELEIGELRCNAGEYTLCIEPNGDVLPCQSYYTTVGNILHDPWEQIWQSDLFYRFRNRTHDPEGSGLPEMCWDCPDLPVCGGGCPLDREGKVCR